jgi:Uma2 family endonuclease
LARDLSNFARAAHWIEEAITKGRRKMTLNFSTPGKPIEYKDEDHFVHLYNKTWKDYLQIGKIRGDKSSPKIQFIDGTIEIMSPSGSHEEIKSTIGCLVEVFFQLNRIDFRKVGSWTLKSEKKRAIEPDECYAFTLKRSHIPDLAIEVIWTSGSLNKLGAYRKLGVPEIWVWKRGVISIYISNKPLLADGKYAKSEKSEAVPGIDLAELASFIDRPFTSNSIEEYRAHLLSQ